MSSFDAPCSAGLAGLAADQSLIPARAAPPHPTAPRPPRPAPLQTTPPIIPIRLSCRSWPITSLIVLLRFHASALVGLTPSFIFALLSDRSADSSRSFLFSSCSSVRDICGASAKNICTYVFNGMICFYLSAGVSSFNELAEDTARGCSALSSYGLMLRRDERKTYEQPAFLRWDFLFVSILLRHCEASL